MNWNFISVVAETVASVTVIISLIYLAIQVRLQAKEYRMMVTNSLTQQWGEALQTFAVHEDLYKIWMAGLQDFHALNAVERGRFSSILMNLTQIFESLHLHYQDGKVDPALWEAFHTRLCDVFAAPGVQQWWVMRRHWHTRKFSQCVDRAIANCHENVGRFTAIFDKSPEKPPEDRSHPVAA